MAVATVTFEGTRVNDAEALGTVWFDLGGKAAVQEPDFVWQGTYSVSEKVGTTELGVIYYNSATSYNFASPAKTVILKHIATNSSALNVQGSTGGILEIGTGNRSAYYRYYVTGNDTYPSTSSWLITPIDPNVAAYRDATVGGGATLTTINYYGWACTFGAASKSENVAMDAIDWVENGKGLLLVGGDGAGPAGIFQDFVLRDQGQKTTGRWGLATENAGVKFALGTWTIGSTTATVFTDSNETIAWPDGRYDTGFAGIKFVLSNASNVFTVTSCTFLGDGNKATNDTRPNLTVSGTTGTLALTKCNFLNFNASTLTSATTATNCSWVGPESLAMGGGTLTRCTFDSPTVATSTAFLTSADLTKISYCSFVSSGTGHAIEYTATTTPVTFVGNLFTGYGADTTGDAAIFNNSGTAITINITGDGDTPTYRNGTGATTTIVNSRTLTLSGLVATSEVRIYETGTTTELTGIEDSSTSFAYSYPFADAGNGVDIVILHVDYVYYRIDNYLLSTTSTSIPIQQRFDRNYVNP